MHSVVPLFLWDEATEPEQPMAVRRRRRAGVRIYLERPVVLVRRGELLGVLLAPGGVDNDDMTWVSQWGGDPVWVGAPVARRAMFLELPDLLHATRARRPSGRRHRRDHAPAAPPEGAAGEPAR